MVELVFRVEFPGGIIIVVVFPGGIIIMKWSFQVE
jgi:hypothetical protein